MIVEAAIALCDAEVEIIDVEWDDLGWSSAALGELNPLGQLPTLVLPDGSVMTESAAMLMHLHDAYPQAQLIPTASDPERNTFLRWFVFLVAAVYPTFTYGDVPKRWVGGDAEAGARLEAGTDDHRKDLDAQLEEAAAGPWFLGDRFCAIDLYLWVMRWWRPGPEWFAEHCPKLSAIGERALTLPAVTSVQGRNFPDGDTE